ncbi:MAG: hypothetical protein PHH59_03915 [Methylovulum sp.]|uniref:HvfA family oxazolone/thioamide-modified RiPP metallophore n=1 Tax=Methylovulum sp. TaxID=1916980 RepID=UPI00262B3799|nr:hypothetical protein [Methylovulum sp.]MDD2723154.1 hypothetical protein [Methylovulum sp.]MDD5126026.1 hypothetical protein [Methylovulum sp.]
MNKTTLALTFGGIIATALSASPIAFADNNPFGMKEISGPLVVAEADQAGTEKAQEGKCGEGKCGAKKAKMAEAAGKDKTAEGKCGAGKMAADKMKEGSCGGNKK